MGSPSRPAKKPRDSPSPLKTQPSSAKNTDKMEGEVATLFDNGNAYNNKLKDALTGLISANNDRKVEIDGLRTDVDKLRSEHDALEVTTTRENDLRKNEIKSLEERQQKDNTARITDIAKLDGKVDTNHTTLQGEIKANDESAKAENAARKSEIEALKNFAETENEARKTATANVDNFARTENDGRKADIAALVSKVDSENAARTAEDQALSDRLNKEVSERETAIADLQARSDGQNDERISDVEDLKTRMLKENAYRTKAYDGGGEENLTFQGAYTNIGGGLDIDTGIFTCPIGGTYIFQFHIATHDNKKALLSIRKNGEEIASIFDQNHKDNHKNSMAGQSIILDVKKGDEIVVYAYTGTWLADFPMNHYTHWVGLLLKPSQEEIDEIYSKAGEAEVPVENGF